MSKAVREYDKLMNSIYLWSVTDGKSTPPKSELPECIKERVRWVDNIAKIVLDGLNPKMKVDHRLHKAMCVHEGLYQDDRQVIDLRVEKWYSDEPRVEITATWADK